MRVASAPVSFGIFELTAADAGLPDPVAVLDAMVVTAPFSVRRIELLLTE